VKTTAQSFFENFIGKDPRIKVDNNYIILYPYVFNHTLVIYFFPPIAALYIMFIQRDFKLNLFGLLIILVSIVIIITQLRYCNTIIIDTAAKTVRVRPNNFLKLFVSEKVFNFNEIKDFNIRATLANAANVRYIISLILLNGNKIRLISTYKKNVAVELTKNLFLIVH
jgi:hypothetical protein